jgi:hypothetical protein
MSIKLVGYLNVAVLYFSGSDQGIPECCVFLYWVFVLQRELDRVSSLGSEGWEYMVSTFSWLLL